MNHKAAITQETLIYVIIIVVSFIVLGYAALKIAGLIGPTMIKETCHTSVILRSSALLKGTHFTPELLPLKCKTQQIEISSSDTEEISRELANAMYDCWWQLGEGKIDFFDSISWWNITNPLAKEVSSCVICSQISFKDAALNKKINLVDYMSKTRIPNRDITYLDYFNNQKTILPSDIKINPIDTNKKYSIFFMGMRGGKLSDQLKTGAISGGFFGLSSGVVVGAAAGTIYCMATGVGAIISPLCGIVGGIIGGLGGTAIGTTVGSTAGAISLVVNSYASSVYCDEKTGGCFIMNLVETTPDNIVKQCKYIESIP